MISFAGMDASIVAVISDVKRDGRPLVGFGFNSNGRYSAGGIMSRGMVPRILAADPVSVRDDEGTNFDPSRVWDAMMLDEKPGGHGDRSVAVGVLDMAIHDLVAKVADLPLHECLARRAGTTPERTVFVYAAGGYYYPDRSTDDLRREIEGYLEAGYTIVKIKIGGAALADDLRRVEAVIETVGDASRVAVDASGRLEPALVEQYAAALAPYGLWWFEEPVDPLDYRGLAGIAACYDGPLATGENLFSLADVRNLVRHGGLRADRDYLQFDPALSYGLVEYERTLAMLAAEGWSPRRCIPHGGHQFALELAAGLHLGGNESYPGVFEPIGGFADGVPAVEGRVAPSSSPGIGIERKQALHRAMQTLLA